jgi:hypothetical protein
VADTDSFEKLLALFECQTKNDVMKCAKGLTIRVKDLATLAMTSEVFGYPPNCRSRRPAHSGSEYPSRPVSG